MESHTASISKYRVAIILYDFQFVDTPERIEAIYNMDPKAKIEQKPQIKAIQILDSRYADSAATFTPNDIAEIHRHVTVIQGMGKYVECSEYY